MLLKLLDTADIQGQSETESKIEGGIESVGESVGENKKSIAESASHDNSEQINTAKLLKLMKHREDKIYQLFEHFSPEELQLHLEQLQTMAALDSQLIEKVNRTQESAKSEILTLKKNKKAINLYQKR
ncbi:hypothetical protein H4J58_15140 [Colwellia sp. MB3u-70]|uniref:hypothetical protein n=1 Tax=unclassified Colwellia TaxID=196834 RepID=UPI0015F37759|nr:MULTISPECIES: hypothetical protein [unclassified Colwellia]MBA6291803.1 hypothetical protein [Colwellia sp. MB3u-8]MBA6308447.1 hypothetical protein [Colwellia sp. MB3u-70]